MDGYFSDTSTNATTLVELLRWRALQDPTKGVFTFLLDGETEETILTYEGLDQQARAIGAWLQSIGATGERALLLYPDGPEFVAAFFGCLYAGVIAVPSYPPRLNRPSARLQSIVADAQATVGLTTSELLSSMERRMAHTPGLRTLQWIATDDLGSDLSEEWLDEGVDRDTVAFLQYTSGSTASPKGVMLSHDNLIHNSSLIQWFYGTSPETRAVIWLPLYHDMGLIGGILQFIYCGGTCTLMSPMAFLQRPLRWLQAVSRTKADISGGPNFAYDLCVRKIKPEQRETLDLSSWKTAFNGAEPIRSRTLEQFATAFEPYGFHRDAFFPCYGLAETSLIVTGNRAGSLPVVRTYQRAALEENKIVEASEEDEGARSLVSSGQLPADHEVAIVDPEMGVRCPAGRVGEIWVSGPSVSRGYWNRPQETEQTFQAYLKDTGEGPFLRTGDLGFIQDAELFITGRLKDLIIINGHNHSPEDIELTTEQSHPALQEGGCAAFSVDIAGQEQIIIVAEVVRNYRSVNHRGNNSSSHAEEEPQSSETEEIVKSIRRAVAENHQLQVYDVQLLKPMRLPRTSSGKVMRHASRSGYVAGTLHVVE